ncbi:cyclopropane-fatty-acyl-phospholipid synthase [Fistulifera solaris]|uniref:Cyclopropane-fatty-acyl-phospholipid synthase n=1 Tax=Fistulifera solaris TaxID=1519565 RepID=A0A1Z5KRX5_FISSO|nr:cyclopropane-fatty-acyl-phospholipid synthase [Fistulifera solaris]|eukprot:GAX29039.1 cyclopropane-fatty-acyl-phospholipid synthase [Fistulifera solaris]
MIKTIAHEVAYWTSCLVIAAALAVFRTVVFLLPVSFLKKVFTAKMEKLGILVTNGPKAIGFDKNKYTAEMVIHSDAFYKHLGDGPLLHVLGDTYMDGLWTDFDESKVQEAIFLKAPMRSHPMGPLWEWNHVARNQQTVKLSKRVAEEHYDLGNDLYAAFLDETMTYTCAYWTPETRTLKDAQIAKLDLIARKLKLKPGLKVLEIGCGFGGAAKYMAENYGVSVVGYNISVEQVKIARERTKGLPVEIRVEDYRNANEKFDRIFSVGFFEAVGSHNFRAYFEVCDRCLKEDGIMLLHTITSSTTRMLRAGGWLNKYIFPGGELPFTYELVTEADPMFRVEDMHNMGDSYAKTLKVWNDNFNRAWPELKPKYDSYFGGKFKRCWNNYLQVCRACFDAGSVSLIQVVYTRDGVKGGYICER